MNLARFFLAKQIFSAFIRSRPLPFLTLGIGCIGLLIAPVQAQSDSERDQLRRANEEVAALNDQGKHQLAVAKAKAILFRLGTAFKTGDPALEDTYMGLATGYFRQGDFENAITQFERILKSREERLGADHPDTLYVLDSLGGALNRAGRSDEAELAYRRVIEGSIEELGEDDPYILQILRKLAVTLGSQDKLDESRALYAELLPKYRAIIGENDPQTLNLQYEYGLELNSIGAFEKAAEIYTDLFARRALTLGTDHPETQIAKAALGKSLADAGKVEQGLEMMDDALASLTISYGADDALVQQIAAVTAQMREQANTPGLDSSEAIDAQLAALGNNDADEKVRLFLIKAAIYKESGNSIPMALALQDAEEIVQNQRAKISKQNRLALAQEMADAFGQYGDPDMAIDYTQNLIDERKALLEADDPMIAVAQNIMADLLRRQGRFADADPYIRAARDSFIRKFGADNGNSVSMTTNLAVNLDAMGRFSDAEPLFRQAISGWDKVYGERTQYSLAPLNGLAINLKSQGRYDESASVYGEEIALRERLAGPDDPDTINARLQLGRLYNDQGRYGEAEPYFSKALADYQRVLGDGERDTIDAMDYLAVNLKDQGRLDEAQALHQRTLDTALARFGENDQITQRAYNNLGRTFEAGENFESAESNYRKALALGAANFGDDNQQTLIYEGNLGAALLYQNRFDEAEALIRKTLEARTRTLGPDHPQTLYSLNDLALTLFFSGRFAEAEPLYRQIVPAFEQQLGKNHPFTIQSRNNYGVALLSDPGSAQRAYDVAETVVEAMRERRDIALSNTLADAGQSSNSNKESFYFQSFMDAAWQLGEQAPEKRGFLVNNAVRAAQEAMDGPASKAVAESAARRAAGEIDSGLAQTVRERSDLSDQWLALGSERNAALASGAENSAKVQQLEQSRSAITRRIAAIDATIQTKFPKYFELVRGDPVPLLDMMDMMRPDEALILVQPSEFGTHVFAIYEGNVMWKRADLTRPQIDLAVKRLLWDVGGSVAVTDIENATWSAEGDGAYPFDRQMAYALYQQLIAPVESAINGKRHVFIAAGGSLSSLPFGLLVTEKPEGMDGDPNALRATKWFADSHALIQIPSLQSLQFLRDFANSPNKRRVDPGGFIGFGDPVLTGQTEIRGQRAGASGIAARQARRGRPQGLAAAQAFVEGGTRAGGGMVDIAALKNMARLPGTAVELEAMRQALSAPQSSIYTGAKATETAVRNADLSNARILALATHGLMAGEVNGAEEPGLVFTPPDNPTANDDGLLTASEVAALNLNADWVILSACNTAAGDGSKGAPGLSGLARAFFYAGARNLLASHWPVRDDVAARLTVRTVEIARDQPELSRAEAFNAAMREIRNDPSADSDSDTFAHPNAWAPFTLIGDGAQ